MADFKIWFKDTMQAEGPWDNKDTSDDGNWRSNEPGPNGGYIAKEDVGECIGTKWGIEAAEYSNYKGHPVTIEEMQNMTVEEAVAIAKPKYWDAMRCDEIKDQAVAGQIADNGYNVGTGTDLKTLQGQLGIPVTGKMDNLTLNTINDL